MHLSDFDYGLPPERIAQRPIAPRDAARLLVVNDALEDRLIKDLSDMLSEGDLLVFNDTRVVPTRLGGRRRGAKVEVTLHKEETADTWRAFARPARKLKRGDLVEFAPDFAATVMDKGEAGEVLLKFDCPGETLRGRLEQFGAMPLPPYIKRGKKPDDQDRHDYQTMFADKPGAVAAPTAGLHFTPELMNAIGRKGIGHVCVTLHVGAGTFLPVKSETIAEHKMHAEWGGIDAATAEAINRARANGGNIVPVGTTALRLLETAAREDGTVRPFTGETSLFITPGYRFKIADRMLTNFHLPRSTLFMLVCAFAGTARMKAAYAHAVAHDYRFYSYGDACLLSRGEAP
ncbi:MAG: tRNA preQ1(34) S-adenosylmethionine ribosyltransferase-isomerase QueA [Rhodospirillales bacterium]